MDWIEAFEKSAESVYNRTLELRKEGTGILSILAEMYKEANYRISLIELYESYIYHAYKVINMYEHNEEEE